VAARAASVPFWAGRGVIAGTDFGFAQGPFVRRVHPSIMWAKLQSLVQGGELATRQLWV
jgi:5-methyltetrahydropteroyltriglutamate--homocysteine methyltransferase